MRNSHLILTTALVNEMKSLHIEKSEDYHCSSTLIPFHFVGTVLVFHAGISGRMSTMKPALCWARGLKGIQHFDGIRSDVSTDNSNKVDVPRVWLRWNVKRGWHSTGRAENTSSLNRKGVESLKRVILLLLVQFIQNVVSMRIVTVRNLFFFLPLPMKQSDEPLSDSVRQKIRRIKVAGIYEWIQFDADPKSGVLKLWLF